MGNIWCCRKPTNLDNNEIKSDLISEQKTNQNIEVNFSNYNFNNDDDNDNIISKNDQKTNQNEEVNLSNNNFNNDDDNDNIIDKKNDSGISFENKEKKSNINPIGTYEYNGKKFNKYSLEQFQENNFKW